ncbi:uncharacterized protein LOC120863756 isoform X2 [Oryx dammah]|uniref:uncharacterized protein LOC120860244 isoform X2 n=1 Tax=Oryx dammah TaxID=59534 RepID=UPI001A9B57D0|nr:uncharacterized protein LOC120860244 isoform X2 [Oryx dammah]XP_040096263.1 uncharacterized protein LOC120863756 isoform X2 [Oryx dammah]
MQHEIRPLQSRCLRGLHCRTLRLARSARQNWKELLPSLMGENEALYWPLSEKLKISLFSASVPNPMTLISRLFTSTESGWWKSDRVLCYCASFPNPKFSDFQLTARKWTWWQYLHHRGILFGRSGTMTTEKKRQNWRRSSFYLPSFLEKIREKFQRISITQPTFRAWGCTMDLF